MDKLNSDEKILILSKLSAGEIMKTCGVNKDLSRACGDPRYNPLWYQKIKDDFNTIYNKHNPYEEYKRLFLLYRTQIFTVSIADENNNEYYSEMFLSRKEAEAYIIKNCDDIDPRIVLTNLRYTDRMKYYNNIYVISEGYIQKPDIGSLKSLQSLDDELSMKKEEFVDLLKDVENTEEIIQNFEELILDFKHDLSVLDEFERENYINDTVDKHTDAFIEENNLIEYKKEIKDYVKYII